MFSGLTSAKRSNKTLLIIIIIIIIIIVIKQNKTRITIAIRNHNNSIID